MPLGAPKVASQSAIGTKNDLQILLLA